MSKLAVHPAADIFPMMTDEELQELAADIAENGQRLPIMLDCEGGSIIDGRNRLAACKLANVEPVFDQLAVGEDPVAFIASINILRRNLNKGQQAMGLAMLYPEPARLKRKGSGSLGTKDRFSAARLSQAREVLRCDPELAKRVFKGTRMLDEALQEVHQRQGTERSRDSQIEELLTESADLGDMVNDGRMKFDQAIAEYHRRILEQQRIRESVGVAVEGLSKFPGYVAGLRQAIDAGAASPLNGKLMKLLHDGMATLDKVWEGGNHNGKG